jgi:serine/threonine-protein kinase RsbW
LERLLVISSSMNNLEKVRRFLEEVYSESNLNRASFNRVFLGLSEALTNSIVHGNKFNVLKNISIEVSFLNDELFIEITDEGEGFLVECLKDPTCSENLKKESGRGIFLIRHFADELEYFEGGRKVRIKYNLDQ